MPILLTIRGAFPVWEYSQTNARLLGIDANASIDITQNVSTSHKFSIVKGLDTSTNIPLINMPAPKFTNAVSYNIEKWNNLMVRLESNYLFRQNETPENIVVFSPQADEEVLLRINDAPDAAHIINGSAEVTFPFKNKNELNIGLTVNNILNTNYRDYLNRLRYFADDLGRNFLLRLTFNY